MKKFLIILVSIIIILALIYSFFFKKEQPFVLYGNVDIKSVNVSFYLNGKVKELLKQEGDEVKVGDLLAVLDDETFKIELEKAKAAKANAQANLDMYKTGYRKEDINQAQLQLNSQKSQYDLALSAFSRQDRLMKTNATSKKDYEDSLNKLKQEKANLDIATEKLAQLQAGYRIEEIEAANANLALANANVEQANLNLDYTKLISPTDGVILTRAVEVGAFLPVGATVYSISIIDPIYIISYIDEINLGRIFPGQKVEIFTDLGKSYIGQIGFISPKAEFTPKTVQTEVLRTRLVYRFRIVVEQSQANEFLRQGMPVTIRLIDDKN